MDVGFDKIEPTPPYPPGTDSVQLATHGWDSKVGAVVAFKKSVKKLLREAQLGRCCYCRRLMSDDIATHIEHFIEKAQYPQFAFEIRNLALSCGTCNTQKNGTNRALTALLKRRADREGKVPPERSATLGIPLGQGVAFPGDAQSYRWVHPHLDNYSANIELRKGWIFAGISRKGHRTIQGVRLNALSAVERRALMERLAMRGGRLSTLIASLAELEHHRAKEVAEAVVKVLRRRRN